jgi:hypothetical protein
VAQEPSPRQNVVADAEVPEFKFVTGKFPVTPVDKGKPVALVNVADVGVPRIGVTNVGEVANTADPVPVSSVKADRKFALLGVAKKVATPVPRPLTPVAIGSPVALVNVALVGVPSMGVTSVGLVDNTLLPDPVDVPTPVPPLVTLSNGPASNNASMLSKSVLILVPQVSVDAPTSGLVNNRFVVVVSAIFYPYAAICQDSLLSAIAVQVSLLSAIASHVSDVSVIGVQVSELSEIASQVSAVSDSGTHFRLPAIVMDDWQVKLMALVCVRVLLTVMADWDAISADARKTTLVATVIVAKSSIRIWTSGTLTPLTDIVLVSTEANAPMATRLAAKLALDVAEKVEAATA